MNKRWTKEQIQFIKDNAHIFTDSKLAQELTTQFGRTFTKDATRKMRQRIGGLFKEAHRSFFKMKVQ